MMDKSKIWFYDGIQSVPMNVTTVVVEDGVEVIPRAAFYERKELESIQLPSSIKRIEFGAFHYCYSLLSMTLSSSIQHVNCSFSFCSSLVSIHIPSTIKKIEPYTFVQCRSLASIELPSSIEEIGEGAFSGCSSLRRVVLPSSLKVMGALVFQHCATLEYIDLPSSGITKIGSNMFLGCKKLVSMNIPSSIQHIGDHAFYECVSLTSITIPRSVQYIGKKAFYGCQSLTSITIPSSLRFIGQEAFHNNCKQSTLHSIQIQFAYNKFDEKIIHKNTIKLFVRLLLMNPRVAQSSCCIDHSILPLHLTLMYGVVHQYDNIISKIVNAAPTSLTECDSIYNFYPFLLAACNPLQTRQQRNNLKMNFEKEHIYTVYMLLHEAPWVMDTLIRTHM